RRHGHRDVHRALIAPAQFQLRSMPGLAPGIFLFRAPFVEMSLNCIRLLSKPLPSFWSCVMSTGLTTFVSKKRKILSV
ncbi:MAG: hypothetical protein ACLP8B_24855, partial [Xanthobacteraceae bacterium]